MIIDSHHHFWHYTAEEYDWIDAEMALIRRDFLPADLEMEVRAAGVDGVVTVQARQTLAETTWLLDLASRHPFMRGVVGWLPLASPRVGQHLEELSANSALKGVRHVVQGEPDDGFILGSDFNRGVALLQGHDLTYDILIVERQLPNTILFVDRHPEQRFVLNHIAKPRIRHDEIEPWAGRIRELARRANVWCKLSGMVSECDHHAWTAERLRPYMDVVLEAFGPSRVMFGTDWPVCLVACDYARWLGIVRAAIKDLSADEQADILGHNAVRAYRL